MLPLATSVLVHDHVRNERQASRCPSSRSVARSSSDSSSSSNSSPSETLLQSGDEDVRRRQSFQIGYATDQELCKIVCDGLVHSRSSASAPCRTRQTLFSTIWAAEIPRAHRHATSTWLSKVIRHGSTLGVELPVPRMGTTLCRTSRPVRSLVKGPQCAYTGSGWPVRTDLNVWDEDGQMLLLRRTRHDFDEGVRAVMLDVLSSLRWHMDVSMSDGRGMLLRYCGGYVPKIFAGSTMMRLQAL